LFSASYILFIDEELWMLDELFSSIKLLDDSSIFTELEELSFFVELDDSSRTLELEDLN